MQRLLRCTFTTLIVLSLSFTLNGCGQRQQPVVAPVGLEGSAVEVHRPVRLYLLQPSSLRLVQYGGLGGSVSADGLLAQLVQPESSSSELISPVPEGVALKVLGVEGKIITVELTVAGTPHWSTRREAILFDSVVLTLTELPDVEAVQFVVTDSKYTGRVDLSQPYDRNRLLAPQEGYEPW